MGYFKAAFVGTAASFLFTLVLLSTAAARANEAAPQPFDIRPQSLAAALSEFARQSHEEILFAPDIVAEKRSGGVRGTMQPFAALKILLNDSGLPFTSTPSGAILIGQAGLSPVLSTAEATDSSQKEGKKNSSQDFRVAQVDQGKSASITSLGNQSSNSQENSNSSPSGLSEIIVTAQKKSERLQDVPVPVTALTAQSLIDNNQVRIQDYYTSVPGLNFTMGNRGEPSVSIRGITTGLYNNPTVGITVDDVSYGSSTSLGGGYAVPDLDPSDLAQVEVLRGPQGTLYGASSIGGLIKFVTVDPSTEEVSGRVQAGASSAHNGDGPGYSARGAVNVPLSETFAVRASGFTRRDPGYVDNVQTGENGVNWADAYGGRLSGLWRPSQDLSLKFSALLQDNNRHGSPNVYVEPGFGDLQQSTLRGTGIYDKQIQAYGLNLTAKLGGLDLVALSGYSINKALASIDYSSAYGAFTQSLFGVTGAPIVEQDKTNKFTQEIRLSAPVGQRFDWLFGAFYTHEASSVLSSFLAVNPDTRATAGRLFDNHYPTVYTEYAAFTDVTIHFTDRFDVQIGGRESQNKQSYSQTITGPLAGPSGLFVNPEVDTKENSFTYLVTPQFKVSPDLMVYARLASGYRPGGPNGSCALFNFPCHFDPDKTQNYEFGVKGNVADHALTFDASVYYIDWKHIQVTVEQVTTQESYNTNGSRAKSQGVEFSVESRPLSGLTIAAWVAWNDAKLTEPFPPTSVYGVSGDRLPYSSRFSGNFSLEQDFPLWRSVTGFVGGTVSYVGGREGVFTASPQRQNLPAYANTDLRAGAKYDSWTLNFFVSNVADRRGVLDGGVGTFPAYAFTYIQPRTAGLWLSRTF